MHSHLQREVDVVVLEQDERLIDDQLAVLERQRSRRAQEGGELLRSRQVVADDRGGVRQELGTGCGAHPSLSSPPAPGAVNRPSVEPLGYSRNRVPFVCTKS